MAYAIGHISGCHLNPAVSVGLVVGKRFPASELLPYIIAQLAGAIIASGMLYLIASGRPDFSLAGGFASNGYGVHSPGGYSLMACFVAEVVLTAFFSPHHPWSHRSSRPQRLRAHRHRVRSYPDPPHQHPGHQYLG